jgi:lipopolysaccharide export system protein LptA
MLSQKMTVFYDDEKSASKNTSGKIKKIISDGDVKVFSKEFIATSDFGYYEPLEDRFILEKNVTVNNGTSIATGDKFIYNLKTKRGNFVGKNNEANITGDRRIVVIIGDDLKSSDIKKKK